MTELECLLICKHSICVDIFILDPLTLLRCHCCLFSNIDWANLCRFFLKKNKKPKALSLHSVNVFYRFIIFIVIFKFIRHKSNLWIFIVLVYGSNDKKNKALIYSCLESQNLSESMLCFNLTSFEFVKFLSPAVLTRNCWLRNPHWIVNLENLWIIKISISRNLNEIIKTWVRNLLKTLFCRHF